MKKVFIIISILFLNVSSFGQNQNLSNGNIFDGEPFIAVNPLNSLHMVVAWMGYFPFERISIKTKVTFDAGQTWSPLNSVPHTNALYGSADPSIDFDNSGNIYLSFIDFNRNLSSGAVFVVKSVDGGLSWETPVEVINANADTQKPIDRPWISVDRSNGINNGNVYLTTMPPVVFGPLPPPYHPYFIASTDGGNSFTWRYLDSANWLAGNIIRQPMPSNCVSSNGTIHAVYPSYLYSQNVLPKFIHAASTDGGISFSYHTVFSAESSVNDSLAKKGYLILSDPSEQSHLVFAYLDKTFGDIDLFIRESYDAGVTWGNSQRVNDDPISNDRMQDLLWGDFDSDGDLILTWRDRRNGADSTYQTSSEIWGAVMKKDSVNFSANFKISDSMVAYDSILANSGNDFMCVKFVNDTLNAVWGDTRDGKLNIWFQRMSTNGNVTGIKKIHTEEVPIINLYPNPASSIITIKGNYIKNILIYNILGEVVAKYDRTNIVDISRFPNGNYFFQINTAKGMVLKKVVKLK